MRLSVCVVKVYCEAHKQRQNENLQHSSLLTLPCWWKRDMRALKSFSHFSLCLWGGLWLLGIPFCMLISPRGLPPLCAVGGKFLRVKRRAFLSFFRVGEGCKGHVFCVIKRRRNMLVNECIWRRERMRTGRWCNAFNWSPVTCTVCVLEGSY